MTGKEKCRMLREIRAKIAEENGLPVPEDACTHEGPCPGTCPACEAEVRQLERGLEKRAAMGKRIALAGLCAGMVAVTTGCSAVEEFFEEHTVGIAPAPTEIIELEGDVPVDGVIEPEGEVPEDELIELMGEATDQTVSLTGEDWWGREEPWDDML